MKILKDSSIYIIGEIFSKVLPFMLLPYLTRKLGTNGYGELANIQAYIALAVVFIGMSQQGAVARYFYFYGKRSIGLVVSSGYIYSIIISFLLLSISYFTQNIILLYVTLTAFSQTLLGVQLTLRQCQKKAFSYTLIQIINGLLTVLITVFLFEVLEATYENRVLAIVSANTFSFMLGSYLYSKQISLKLLFSLRNRKNGFLYLFAFGGPLIFHQLSFFLKGQLDRIFIHKYFSAEELGVYAAGYQLAAIFSILLMAVNKAAVPLLYEKLKAKEIGLINITRWVKYSFIFVPIPSLVAYLIPEFIYIFVLGDGFIGSKYFTVIFLLGLGITIPYLLIVNYLFYHGRNKQIAYCSILSSIVYVLFVFIFSSYSLTLVPFSLVVSNCIMILLLFYVIKSDFKKSKYNCLV